MGARAVAHSKAVVALDEARYQQHPLDYAHIKEAVDIASDEWERVVRDLTEVLEEVVNNCACVGDAWAGAILGIVQGRAALREEQR